MRPRVIALAVCLAVVAAACTMPPKPPSPPGEVPTFGMLGRYSTGL